MKKMNKKYLVRVLAMVLSILMLLSLAACVGDETEETADTSTLNISTETDELKPEFSGNTYDGRDFIILCRKDTDEGTYKSDIIISEITQSSSQVDKAVYERNKTIEDLMDIRFTYVEVANETQFIQKINAATMSDADTYDLVSGHGRYVFKGVLNGFYMDWNQLEYVNLDAPWWSQSAREEWTTPSKRLYMMNGDLSYMSIGSANVMYFNRNIFSNARITTPYEHVKNDNWTLETFEKSVRDVDTAMLGDGSGLPETDTFGYGTEAWRGPIQAVYSAGVSTFAKDGDGKFSIAIDSNRVTDAFGDYQDLVNNSGAVYYAGIGIGAARDHFMNEVYAYFDDNVKSAVEFNGSGLNFGIVPWPKYDGDTENYNSLVGSGTNTFAVLKNTSGDNRIRISDVLEAMAYYGYKDVIPYYFDTVISYQAAQDEHTYEMLQLVRETLHFDLGHYANFGGIGDIGKDVVEGKEGYGETISTAISAIKGIVKMELEVWYQLED